ncbi:MAG: FAD-dependent oxidoreductase [bacterium]
MHIKTDFYDIIVVGGTPAGIMSAIAAGRLGSRVMLTEYHGHIGGMSTSGLGKSDVENKEAIAGLFREFTQRVLKYYMDKYGRDSEEVFLCKEGYYYEPSVAEIVFNQMICEVKTITLLLNQQIVEARIESSNITGLVFRNRNSGELKTIRGNVYIDATYEGDLYALAGAKYRLGRESKDEFNEKHAGRIFFDYNDKVFLEGSTGKGDNKLPAYTYRLCLTDDPENSYVLNAPPSGYNRSNYIKYFEDLNEGRLGPPKVFKEGHGYYIEHFNTMVRVFSFARIPNRKFDVNINPRPLGFPFVEQNYTYPESGWGEREKIFIRLRELVLGLLYFVQNDPEVPEKHREIARQYHLPLDEFADNRHFPWQLYVREARRLNGKYTLSENDVTVKDNAKRTRIFYDSIICGEFPIDSFPVSKEPSVDKKVLEGYIGMLEISPYQIPYRILLPEEISNLIVPVAASTTHVAFSTIRMEPLWMGIGQAAGIAANIALKMKVGISDLSINDLQKELLDNNQIITFFKDVTLDDKAFKAMQFWGTKGFFDTYHARPKEYLITEDFNLWLKIFSDLSGNNIDPLDENMKEVSISAFSKIIYRIEKEYGKTDPDFTYEDYLAHSEFRPDEWLYNPREYSLPLLRGEACLALYYMFFIY